MSNPNALGNLGSWVPEPTVMKPALEWIEAAGRPVLLREVAEAMGKPITTMSSLLARLVRRGILVKDEMESEFPNPKAPGKVIKRKLSVYRLAPAPGRDDLA